MIKYLAQLQIDGRSPAAFGLAYIFATLSVTNMELRALALAEKDISVEQYDKIMELQRIKAKDEAGEPLEEPKVMSCIQRFITAVFIKYSLNMLGGSR